MLRLAVDNGSNEATKEPLMFINHNFNVAPVGQNYGEWSYFDGYAFAHIAAWQEAARLKRIRTTAIKALDRRNVRR